MSASPKSAAKPLVDALSGVLGQVAEPIVVLRAILDQAVGLTGASRGLFVEVAEQGELAYRVLHGIEPKQLEGEAGGFSRQIFRRVLETGREIVLDNALDDPFFGALESVRVLQARAIVCAPIHAGGRVAALLHLESAKPRQFTSEHLDLLRSLLVLAGPILEALQAGRDVLRERDQLRLSEDRYRSEAEENRKLLASDWSFGRFIGSSSAVRELETTVRRAAATEYPVLILGESGTGKSILARVLHYAGPRAAGPLVTVFCPTLEKGMVEAELFGHKRGAFTGALADRLGKVPAADKGTLFLDEIGDLPLEIQPKLLRLLQERTYERVGDAAERRADVRVIAATNADLEKAVSAGRFRRDLYERLCFIPLEVPPLRQRVEDIPLLLRHCLDQTDSGRWIEISPEGLAFLQTLDFSWPGNVRHIEQLAARLTMEGKRGPIAPADLSRLLGRRATDESARRADGNAADDPDLGLAERLEQIERRWLEDALRDHSELKRADLAARLKISESALYKKLKAYGLTS